MATRRNERLIALTVLGVVLFNYPLVALFGHPVLVLGWPLLYFYLFFVWAVFIVVVAVLMRRRGGAVAALRPGEPHR
jgi:hypothetical protein